MKKALSFILISILIVSITSCNNKKKEDETVKNNKYPIATIYLSNDKTIKLELYKNSCPISVNNFIKLSKEGFYDGTVFHRVISSFMIQTGGYFYNSENELTMKDADTIKGEFSSNGIDNQISHLPGVISMARASAYDSASSQFFICVADCTYLDGDYAAFGKTVDKESLNNAIEISNMETYNIGYGLTDFPVDEIYIKTITIEE